MAAVGSADRIRGCGGRIVTTLMLRRDSRRAGRLHQASGVAGHQLLRPQEGGNRDEQLQADERPAALKVSRG